MSSEASGHKPQAGRKEWIDLSVIAIACLLYVMDLSVLYLTAGGLLFVAAGLLLLTRLDATAGLSVLVIGSVVFSLGLGPLFVLTTDLIVGSTPPERAGAASAISETGAELGGALGIAILGSLGTAVYRGGVAKVVPAALPRAATDAAGDTLAGALSVARLRPERLETSFVEAAQASFTHGFHLTAAVGGVIALSTSCLVVTMLRDARTGGESVQEARGVDRTLVDAASS